MSSPVICPTVTAVTPEEFREQVERLEPFAQRVHFDFSDGVFSPRKLINIIEAWWPDDFKQIDFHVMFQKPETQLETIISMNPDLVVVHAEADGNLEKLIQDLQKVKIKAGLALLQKTRTQDVKELLTMVDHVLIFSGDLGHFGGHVDEALFKKITEVKAINPKLEIGWDGGINELNVKALVRAGVDVLNTGGYIQNAAQPQKAYATLKKIADKS